MIAEDSDKVKICTFHSVVRSQYAASAITRYNFSFNLIINVTFEMRDSERWADICRSVSDE